MADRYRSVTRRTGYNWVRDLAATTSALAERANYVEERRQMSGGRSMNLDVEGPAQGNEVMRQYAEYGEDSGGYAYYHYEVGPQRSLFGPLMRMLFTRVDIQRVSALRATAQSSAGYGQILFVTQGWDSGNPVGLYVKTDSSKEQQPTGNVVYPLHAHPIGIFHDVYYGTPVRWSKARPRSEENWYRVVPGYDPNEEGYHRCWFALEGYDAERYTNNSFIGGSQRLTGWSLAWHAEKYNNGPKVVYADRLGHQTDEKPTTDDPNFVNLMAKAVKSGSEQLIHTSSTIMLRLFGLAQTQARYTVKLCRCRPEYMPGRNVDPAVLNDSNNAKLAEDAILESLRVGQTGLASWHNSVHKYVTTGARQNTSASKFQVAEQDGINTIWEEEFCIEPRSELYYTGANKCIVRLHVGQERVKDYSVGDAFGRQFTGFEPPTSSSVETGNSSADVTVASNGSVISQFSRAQRVDRSVYANPREQLFVVVMAHQRGNDTSVKQARHEGGSTSTDNDWQTDIKRFQHSYDIDIYDRFMVPSVDIQRD